MGVKRVYLAQDDVFSVKNLTDDEIMNLYNLIATHPSNVICLEEGAVTFKNKGISTKEKYYNGTAVHHVNTKDWVSIGNWAFDDRPTIYDIDFLIDVIYGDEYFNHGSIFSGEHILNNKFKNITIERCVLDEELFRRVNIVGPNQNRLIEIAWLNKKFNLQREL